MSWSSEIGIFLLSPLHAQGTICMLCFVGSVLFSLPYQECSNSGGCLVLLPGLACRPGLLGAPGCPQPLRLLVAWPSLGMKTHEVLHEQHENSSDFASGGLQADGRGDAGALPGSWGNGMLLMWLCTACSHQLRIVEAFWLERTSEIIKSSH